MSPLAPKAAREPEKRPAPVSVRIPRDLLDEIDAAAKAAPTTRHDAILQLLRKGVEVNGKPGRKSKK